MKKFVFCFLIILTTVLASNAQVLQGMAEAWVIWNSPPVRATRMAMQARGAMMSELQRQEYEKSRQEFAASDRRIQDANRQAISAYNNFIASSWRNPNSAETQRAYQAYQRAVDDVRAAGQAKWQALDRMMHSYPGPVGYISPRLVTAPSGRTSAAVYPVNDKEAYDRRDQAVRQADAAFRAWDNARREGGDGVAERKAYDKASMDAVTAIFEASPLGRENARQLAEYERQQRGSGGDSRSAAHNDQSSSGGGSQRESKSWQDDVREKMDRRP
jgi:ribosomal protein L32E